LVAEQAQKARIADRAALTATQGEAGRSGSEKLP